MFINLQFANNLNQSVLVQVEQITSMETNPITNQACLRFGTHTLHVKQTVADILTMIQEGKGGWAREFVSETIPGGKAALNRMYGPAFMPKNKVDKAV